MTKTVKIIIIPLATVIVLCGLCVFGFRGFTHLVYSQRTCEWANIDNIELHTHIDIPKIKECDCEYKKEQNTKIARFDIDMNNVDMNRYIRFNNFKKLMSINEVLFDDLIKTKSNVETLIKSSDLYYTIGSYKGETWQTLLDITTGRLWVVIKY